MLANVEPILNVSLSLDHPRGLSLLKPHSEFAHIDLGVGLLRCVRPDSIAYFSVASLLKAKHYPDTKHVSAQKMNVTDVSEIGDVKEATETPGTDVRDVLRFILEGPSRGAVHV